MKTQKTSLEPRLEVANFGDICQLHYDVKSDRMEAVGLLGPFEIANFLETISERYKGRKGKTDATIVECANKLASAVIQKCVTAKTFAYVANGPTVRLCSDDAEALLASKIKFKAEAKKKFGKQSRD